MGTDSHVESIIGLDALDSQLASGALADWDALVRRDPSGTLYQGKSWCLSWYRAYVDRFQPLVVTVRRSQQLIGLVPLAIEHGSGRLTFAGEPFSDYGDVVSGPGCRREVVTALFQVIRDGGFPNPFVLGSTQPHSETPVTAAEIAGDLGLRTLRRSHPAWRFWPPARRKPIRHLNFFRQMGVVTIDRVETPDRWEWFKHEFYRQHSLRQLAAGRSVSFDDRRKRAFYDALFLTPVAHVTAFCVNGRLVAGHLGYIWNDILHFGAPAFDLRYSHRSPSLVHLSWLVQEHETWGLRGIDLTIGDSDFKRRLGNERVELPTIIADRSARRYTLARTREHLVAPVKRLVGANRWEHQIKPALERARHETSVWRERGVVAALGEWSARTFDRARGAVWRVHYARPAEQCPAAGKFVINRDRPEDLLLTDDSGTETKRRLSAAAAEYCAALQRGSRLYTAVRQNRLAGFGYAMPGEGTVIDLYVMPDAQRTSAASELAAAISADASVNGAAELQLEMDFRDRRGQRIAAAAGFHLRKIVRAATRTNDQVDSRRDSA